KVMIVEDDPLHRAYLHDSVISALPECKAVLEASNGGEGETLARETPAAHIVMDLQMQPRTGIDAARTIWPERPQTRITFWSNYSGEAEVRGASRSVRPGAACGCVLKSASDGRLRLALRGSAIGNQCIIAGEVRGSQQRRMAPSGGVAEAEYE